MPAPRGVCAAVPCGVCAVALRGVCTGKAAMSEKRRFANDWVGPLREAGATVDIFTFHFSKFILRLPFWRRSEGDVRRCKPFATCDFSGKVAPRLRRCPAAAAMPRGCGGTPRLRWSPSPAAVVRRGSAQFGRLGIAQIAQYCTRCEVSLYTIRAAGYHPSVRGSSPRAARGKPARKDSVWIPACSHRGARPQGRRPPRAHRLHRVRPTAGRYAPGAPCAMPWRPRSARREGSTAWPSPRSPSAPT